MDTRITLFKRQNVDEAWVERRQLMEKDCARVSDAEVLSADLVALSERLAKPFCFDAPEIFAERLTHDEAEFVGDKATITWYIPIRGDERILGLYHRHSPISPVYTVNFSSGVMSAQTTVRRERIADAKQGIDAIVAHIGEYLPEIRRILEIFNPRFTEFARNQLDKRRGELLANEKAKDSLSALGIPVRKRTDEVANTFVNPTRKTIPIPDSPKATPDPVLELKAYDDILTTITSMAHGIERSPETFEGMDEEDIRIVLLIGLNAVYEGRATGETFNGKGRSDILIRRADRNIFIAECLVWDGQAHLLKKLNGQLLTYAVWRDTKTALIVFNRSKDLSSVLQTIDTVLSKHTQCVRKLESTSPTSFRYIYRKLDDPEQHYYLTCLAFNVPDKPAAS